MAAGTSVHDEIREQQQKTKEMSVKGKLSYFWDYYKIHTIVAICVIAFVVSFVHQMRANKPYAFYAVLLNAVTNSENIDTNVMLEDEFQTYAGIDPEAYQVCIDTSLSISDDVSQYDMANRQKMAALMHVGDIHVIVADTKTFEEYAHLETFYDLSEVFTAEELASYADLLYYTDAADFNDDTGDTLQEMEDAQKAYDAKTIDHSDPSAMVKPIPVGIRIPTSGNKLAEAGYYRYLQEDHIFQGYPEETVLGIPLSVEDPKLALQFLSFLNIQ